MFSKLEEFTYSLHTPLSTPSIHPVLSKFFPPAVTTSMVSNLKKLQINIRITDYGNFDCFANDLWIEKLTLVASDLIWVDLDNIFAKGLYFTALKMISIRLGFMKRNRKFFTNLDNDHLVGSLVNTDALRDKIQAILLETFSASMNASISLKISVDLDVQL